MEPVIILFGLAILALFALQGPRRTVITICTAIVRGFIYRRM